MSAHHDHRGPENVELRRGVGPKMTGATLAAARHFGGGYPLTAFRLTFSFIIRQKLITIEYVGRESH
jgi:hypothetical protein